MHIKTKVICTIGPSVNDYDSIVKLVQAGMNVARLNFSHGTHEEHKVSIDLLKQVRKDLNVPLAIMLDTKGPEIRLRKIQGGEVYLSPGQRWNLVKQELEGDVHQATVVPSSVLDNLKAGMQVLFADGSISSKVLENTDSGVTLEILNGGWIRSNNGVCMPDAHLDLPSITERDAQDIRFGCQEDIDLIAASFVRTADDVLYIKKLLDDQHKSSTLVIAKIETKQGVDNFDSIVQVADGIMIARGDLGVQLPLSLVPKLQKMMIRKSYLAGKPAVTATQMLESMIHNLRPTRAEASDVANAIYDSTSAVMLSGETAIGKHPIKVVQLMRTIIEETEEDFDYEEFFAQHAPLVYHDVPSAVTLATVKTAYSSNAKAIFAFTTGGGTARLLSRLRPSMPILAMTENEKCYHQLAFNWGVIPVLGSRTHNMEEAFDQLSSYALEKNYVSNGDLVVLTAGSPFGVSGTTNMMRVENIGDVLVRGQGGVGERVHGNVVLILSPDSKPPYAVRNCLLVMTKCDASYAPLIRESLGVILHNHIHDTESEKWALQLCQSFNKPAIVRADAASVILKEGQLVTLDPKKALIYKGVVF
jgi:pyruvate kinase